MENFVQFFTNVAPFLSIFFILVLIIMLFFEQRKNKKLEQEREAIFLLLWRANQILFKKDKVMVFFNLEDKEKPVLSIAQQIFENGYQIRDYVRSHYIDGELKLID